MLPSLVNKRIHKLPLHLQFWNVDDA